MPIEPTQLEKALKAVRDGHMTASKACKLYSVNTGTVSAHLRGITKSFLHIISVQTFLQVFQ